MEFVSHIRRQVVQKGTREGGGGGGGRRRRKVGLIKWREVRPKREGRKERRKGASPKFGRRGSSDGTRWDDCETVFLGWLEKDAAAAAAAALEYYGS